MPPKRESLKDLRSRESIYSFRSCTNDDAFRLSGNTIKVRAGTDNPVDFNVHEEVIRSSSNFFDKAMSAAWKEAKEGVVSLPEDEPEIFKLYLQWLYNDTIPCEEKGPDHADHVEEYLRLSKAYVLGDKLQDGDFQN